jgi:hypothetical protein
MLDGSNRLACREATSDGRREYRGSAPDLDDQRLLSCVAKP